MTTRHFGEPVPRREDARLTTGQGTFVDDIAAHAGANCYAAAFVRSPHAHARIRDIDVTAALDVTGLVGIYTHGDLTGAMAEPLPLLVPHPGIVDGRTPHALAKTHVHHVGAPVAMVLARDRYVAEDVVERIRVDYEVLDPVVGIEAAWTARSTAHSDMSDNVAARLVQEVGDAATAVARAPHQLDLTWEIERSAAMPLEGRGVHARWDSTDERLRLYSSTQTSAGVRAAVAAKLGLHLGQVECIVPDVGGGFGVKVMHPWPEELLLCWAAHLLGHEVAWTEDRREHFVSSAHERAQEHRVRVGFDGDGRLLGLDVDIRHDNGAFLNYGIIVPIITSTQLLGPYKPETYRVTFHSLYTNTVLVTPYRGAGRPQGVYAMERTMDAIAEYLGRDRAAVRASNLIQPEEMPYDHGLTFQDGRPLVYDSGDFPASLDKIRALVGWDDFESYRRQAQAEGRRVGIGLACYVEGTGVGPYEGGHVQVETDGSVRVATGLTTQGQGHQTILAQIVADELGVALDDIAVTTGDTRRMPYSVGTYASRGAVTSGSAVALASRRLRDKAVRVAAEALEVDPGDLELAGGRVRVAGHPTSGIPLGTVAVLANPLRYAFDEASAAATQFSQPADPNVPPVAEDSEPGLEGTGFYSPVRSTFANGMHAAIVETDPDTAEIRILRYCVVHDCGRIVNPTILEGQVHGGVAQGVAGALYERMAYDDHGQLLNASFMDFLMPYASEVPAVEIDHLETPSPLNPLGVKGAGEAGVIPGSAVLASAIEDAEGFPITRMPISPSELFELRRRHAAGELRSLCRDLPAQRPA
ncbi:aerobic carbon-monoxide dehydrogenase large subunit [Lipingzhangella sp. LS1_29]|uniref:Aerobic carbon-monoxide dehydrogenase large subunit n=1 Tax=Lipingzhangella rawalii TaxID=2055835 RepID=A0ABU2HB41_9ACTN|nr:aerobic carbon-monoxide dehydrogenase large subunit [Lipingzhangella rawalii]MDS1272478.1 aerobic carbon-monoxide dehydrogenase large subunit [Lipingzhangella rawalii]